MIRVGPREYLVKWFLRVYEKYKCQFNIESKFSF